MRSTYLLLASLLATRLLPAAGEENGIRLATLEYPPYIVKTEQGAKGVTVALVTAAFARLGLPVTIEFFPIARGQQKVVDGEVDGYFSIKKTPAREQTLLFTQKVLMSQDFVFFVRKDSPWHFDGNLSSMAGAAIGIVDATSFGNRFDSAVQAGLFKKLDRTVDHETNFRKLIARRVDAVMCSRLVGQHYLAKMNALSDVRPSGPVVETTYSYLAFTRKRDYAELAKRVDQALDDIERDGSLGNLRGAIHEPTYTRP